MRPNEVETIKELRSYVETLRMKYYGLGEDREDILDDIARRIDNHLSGRPLIQVLGHGKAEDGADSISVKVS